MNQYEQICKIGQGTYGCVYKAKNKNGELVAIKHIKYQSHQQGIPATALRQISLLKSFGQHQNIIKCRVLNVCYEPMECHLQIVFQFCDCDLKRYIKDHKEEITEGDIKKIMKQILTGLAVLHEKKIMHRDIKPQNIMLDAEKNVKIVDFGLARYITSKQKTLTREVETLWYRAPEVMLGMKRYTYAIDVWAAGCIFAELYLKRPLFMGGQHEIQQIYKVFEILGTPTKEQWQAMQTLPDFTNNFPKWKKQSLPQLIKNMPQNAMDLLQKLLIYDPNKRISINEALSHPYFSSEIK